MIELCIVTRDGRDQAWLSLWLAEQGLLWAEAKDLQADDAAIESEQGGSFLIYFDQQEELESCLQRLQRTFPRDRINQLSYHHHQLRDQIWQQAWQPHKQHFQSACFEINIAEDALSKPRRSSEIVMQAVQAFGSGQHATTLASLRMLERLPVGRSLLDVGTGTGILAIAAKKLGYETVVATDIDPLACDSAAINRLANEVDFEIIETSLPDPSLVPEIGFDVIVSNILPPVINQLMADFQRLLRSGGSLILAGFHEANARTVLDDSERFGFAFVEQIDERGWLALHLRGDSK